MTFRQYAKDYCVQRGMFDAQADAVIQAVIRDETNQSMQSRWDDKTSDYPQVMLGLVAMAINQEAITYIEKNCPKAWFKPMFE